ncbi:MAG: TadE/TadG family type IV pilus assembly protein [Acidimicrobiales bacterium]
MRDDHLVRPSATCRRGFSPCWEGEKPVRGRSRPLLATDESGVSSLEMAILFPTVLLVILSMFQISLYWHTANAAAVAAEQGLDAGQIFPDDETRAVAEARAAAKWILDTTNHRNGVVDPAVNGNLLTVTVTAEAPRIVGVGTWQVRSVAEGRFEAFVPAGQR